MYCIHCGKELADGAIFCGFCGARVSQKETKNAENAEVRTFIDQQRLQQNSRQGTLIYLQDILTLEFCMNKLTRLIDETRQPIIAHDEWFYWRCYRLNPRILVPSYPPFNRVFLSYSAKLNSYYCHFEQYADCEVIFYDHDENRVNHQLGNPCDLKYEHMDEEKRKRLCTMPIFKDHIFGGTELVNASDLYWKYTPGIYHLNREKNNLQCFSQIKPIIVDFENKVKKREEDYQKKLPATKSKIEQMTHEFNHALELINRLYEINIIPSKFRNLGCMYFIYEYYSTSNTSLNDVFLHLDLDKIQSQLETVIKNQEESLIRQAIIISQNDELLSQNQQILGELSNVEGSINNAMGSIDASLSGIHHSSIETAQWARIAAINSEICAWISSSNFLKG